MRASERLSIGLLTDLKTKVQSRSKTLKYAIKTLLRVSLGCSLTVLVSAQDAQEESIVIDDLSLSELNDQIERVEDEFYRVFNLSIEEEHLKVECADWTPTGTHIAQRACQPYFLSQARNQNLRDWNNQMDVIASPEQMRVRLAAEFEELTAAINSVLEENQYLRELNAILRMLRERAQELE